MTDLIFCSKKEKWNLNRNCELPISIIWHLLTLKRVEQLWEAHVLICAVTEALVVTLSPGIHLSIFGEGH